MMAFMTRFTLILVIITLCSFTLALPTGPFDQLQSRAPSTCNGIKDQNGKGQCNACAANPLCAFDRTTLQCIQRPTVLNANFITNPAQCLPIGNFLAMNPTPTERTAVDREFARMQDHIFVGDATDPTSGRHTRTAFRQANNDAGRCSSETRLCAFRLDKPQPKTVWDNTAGGGYTPADITDICKMTILFNKRNNFNARSTASFVVQTKFNKPICVTHIVTNTNLPSCFPNGIHPLVNPTIGSSCAGTGVAARVGVTTEVARGSAI
ncbi:unnamed protein product [Somion occarium]|uniref:Uncharacterized protein n=1 Tax=Somion occarium TaxID=3059160 RepID=A0ABP1CNQ2_9APHY